MVDKGVRVSIVKGRTGKGVVGTVFWIGDDRFKEGSKRLGIHGDDGETYWVSADNVEVSDAPPPADAGPELARGDRVTYPRGDEPRGEGEVVWIGESKHGPGQRVGVATDDGERLWFDARVLVRVGEGDGDAGSSAADAEAEAQTQPAPPPDLPETWDDEDPLF